MNVLPSFVIAMLVDKKHTWLCGTHLDKEKEIQFFYGHDYSLLLLASHEE